MMFEVGLPLQLRHRENYGILPLLFTNMEHLQKLVKENNDEVHSERISEILLWIAKEHPEDLKNESKLLCHISIEHLCFRDSYEIMDKLISTDAVTTLLNSKVCRNLKKFCGYVHPRAVGNLRYMVRIQLALGKHNVDLFTDKTPYMDEFYISQGFTIHLLCGELDHEQLSSLTGMGVYDDKTVYISDVSDQDVAWVVHAVLSLNQKTTEVDTGCYLKLKGSNLTTTGVDAIMKGLFETEEIVLELGVSSPHISHNVESPGYEDSFNFLSRISDKYEMDCFYFTEMKERIVNRLPRRRLILS